MWSLRASKTISVALLSLLISLISSLIAPITAQANEVTGFFQARPSFTKLSVGHSTACAVTTTNEVWCWGSNTNLQAYSRNSTYESEPRKVQGLTNVLDVAVGKDHSCALLDTKRVVCWGTNELGQLGTGFDKTQLASSAFPEYVNGVIGVTKLEAGDNHACAITDTKELFCWGSNSKGQVGQLLRDESRQIMGRASIPNAERAPLTGVIDVALGSAHTCALTEKGYVYCFGDNLHGQLGQGWNVEKSNTPLLVGALTDVSEVEAGGDTSCAKTTGKSLRCWGKGENGQLGNLDTADLALPTNASASLSKFATDKFSVGFKSVCAKLDNSVVYCWGSNSYAQVGSTNVTTNSTSPFVTIQYPSSDAVEIDSGSDFSCVLTTSVWCWGRNDQGQLGRISVATSGTYAQINNLRWDLSPNSITHTTSGNVITLTWPTIGYSQRYGRVEDLRGNLLCRTVTALTCDFTAQATGKNTLVLFLQVTDANGAAQGMRAEYSLTIDTTSSTAATQIDAAASAIANAAGDKLLAEERARRDKELKDKLAAAELAWSVADKLASYKLDLSLEALDIQNAAKDRKAIANETLVVALTEYQAALQQLSALLTKLAAIKG